VQDYIKRVLSQISAFVGGLKPAKKLALVVVSVIVVAGIGFAFLWAGKTSYRPLMTNLSPEDSTNVIRILRDKRIPFRVDQSGKNIEVPPESMYDLRLELATMGFPQSSIVGYEIFDKQSLGTTSFVQAINDKRAREGELMRTISAMRGVKRARVHLALPKKSTFIEDTKKPTASVVLDLEPGTQLGEKQIYGIGNLVASAVEGLEHSSVNIMDSTGKVLSKNSQDSLVAMTATQLDFKKELESRYEQSIQNLLTPVVGEGRVIARVSAELDFSQVSETQTTYDADGAAKRSEVRNNNQMSGSRPAPGGAAGVASNTPGEPPAPPPGIRTDNSQVRETINYEVPSTVKRTTHPTGRVTKLSVAVVVDGKKVKKPDAQGRTVASSESWSPEQLREFENLVVSAVAIDRKRGDSLEIKNMEFAREDFEEADRILADGERRVYVQNIVIYSVIGLVIALFFLFIVRPFIKWITDNTTESVDTFLPQTIEELERLQKSQNIQDVEDIVPELPDEIDPEKVEGEMIKEKIITLVDSNPHKAALVLRDWLRVPSEKKAAENANKTA
jgi:flagellar M-ring protein FliF